MCRALKQSDTNPVCSVEPSSGECVGIDATCPAEVQPIDGGGCAVSAPASCRPNQKLPPGTALAIGTGLLLFVRGRSTRRRRRLN
jgi:hypothetical protein